MLAGKASSLVFKYQIHVNEMTDGCLTTGWTYTLTYKYSVLIISRTVWTTPRTNQLIIIFTNLRQKEHRLFPGGTGRTPKYILTIKLWNHEPSFFLPFIFQINNCFKQIMQKFHYVFLKNKIKVGKELLKGYMWKT